MTKKLRVYLPFAQNEIKRQMSYKGAFYIFIFISLFGSFISYYIWMAVYGSAKSGSIGGLSRSEMIIYVFMVYVTSSMVTISIADWISEDIVKGTVSMNLIKPIDYRTSLMSRAFGDVIYRFLLPGVFIWGAVEIYKVVSLKTSVTSFQQIFFYLLSCFMSFLIYVLFDFCFGMIAFFTTYIFGLMLAKSALLSFLTGQLIPLSFFPEGAQKVFDFLPFSSMVYTPVMIYLGKYQGNQLILVLLRQLFWVIVLYGIGSLVWRKVTKHLVVLGG
ncbi:daunorubicin resistance transmembrane protein [Lachnospiraceae bacterium KM106-2]|nr:daunorubicin resistance transmembrane protein [Lachnospiraceae bacterium KM106-2]